MSRTRRLRFPTIAEVAAELRAVNRDIDRDARTPSIHGPDDDDRAVDVRLQVYPNGTWAIRVGPSDYDQDHHGYWGSSSLDGHRFDSRAVARDLIEQARDDHAEDEAARARPQYAGVVDT